MRTAECHPDRKHCALGKCSPCYHRAWHREHGYPNRSAKISNACRRSYREANRSKFLLYRAKERAKKNGLDFDLTISDINIPLACPVLGIPLAHGGRLSPNSPSIDRIDNTKGYVRGNIVVVSLRANLLKKDATLDELQRLAKFYANLERT